MESKLLEMEGRQHLIISPHPNDTEDFFDNHLSKLISLFQRKTCSFYNISVEHPDTNKHLDIVYFTNNRPENFNRPIKKLIENFLDTHENTIESRFTQWKPIKKTLEDIKYVIGYNYKEEGQKYGNIDKEFQEECKIYYEENIKEKYVKKQIFQVYAVTSKTLLTNLLEYKHKHPEIAIEHLYHHMVEYGNYSFLAVSEKVQKKALIELKIRLKKTLKDHEKQNFEFMNGLENHLSGLDGYEFKHSIYNIMTSEDLKNNPEKQLSYLRKFLQI
jgi:hypothetical protein